ncbi:MAG: biopolymer transporter ExbD [Planctomycetota bacterium]|nr:hypothetical protein [Planctomycetota bacterium]MEE3054915.1 biopolymer transporter ExbD [Planctomycetota bacterium]|tara:strand:- start:1096 stop:1611 length:516 start_codon:yes stop_codon:yes gene_type:complete
MKKRKKTDDNFEVKMEMTPMIDCVFLLIMFFILTTQITVNIEDVVLPFALEGKVQQHKDTNELMLILNVRKNRKNAKPSDRSGEIVYQARVYNPKELKAKLDDEVAYDAAPPPRGRGRTKEEGPNGVQLSRLEILIRYDKSVRSEYLRQIFEQCQKAGIYKLKLATTQPEG